MGASDIEASIFALLRTRREGATICPSEVARALMPTEDRWKALMPQVRHVAKQLDDAGRIEVTRGGVRVDAMSHGGPIRLGRPK